MQYQLILQFRDEAREYFRSATPVESRVATAIGDVANFDGEDSGPHGANLFFYTDHPAQALALALTVFPGVKSAAGFAVAYRQVSGEEFHVLWPEDSPDGFRLR